MLEFYTPKPEELWFKEALLGDEATMAYNHAYGGTIPFPREKWAAWHARWIGAPGTERFYRYVCEDGVFLGEAAYHWDAGEQLYLADVIIHAQHRVKGYGRQALLMLCDAARDNGVRALHDQIAIDNPALSLFLRCGFEEVMRSEEYVLVRKDLTT